MNAGSSLKEEVKRASEFVESTVEGFVNKLKEMGTEALSYDVVLYKNGHEVKHVPVGVAIAFATLSATPPVRLATIAAVFAGNLAGYTFKFKKKVDKK